MAFDSSVSWLGFTAGCIGAILEMLFVGSLKLDSNRVKHFGLNDIVEFPDAPESLRASMMDGVSNF